MRIAVLLIVGILAPACTQSRTPDPPPRTDVAPWAGGNLSVRHVLRYPTRLAVGPGGKLYVSDARVGSVFIHDRDLRVVGELRGLRRPLGLAVDRLGRIYVGSGTDKCVHVHTAVGARLRSIGAGLLEMPNDIALDAAGRIYVADSRANAVKVFAPHGGLEASLTKTGSGVGLRFPSAVHVAERRAADGARREELYVADQGAALVHVFDLEGRHLRSFGGPAVAFSREWQGRFVKIQSFAMDRQGRLHVLDSYLQTIQILDPGTGRFLRSYGRAGRSPGTLRLPLALALLPSGKMAVASAENGRLEVLAFASEPFVGVTR